MSGFRDAEAWLRERGVEREALRPPPDAAPPVSTREATRLARAARDAPSPTGDRPTSPPSGTPPDPAGAGSRDLGDEVTAAVAYARRATAQTPRTASRLADAMRRRGWPEVVVERAIERCRGQGLVDDDAFARALVDEGRSRGHAPRRLRADLARRGFAPDTVEAALAPYAHEDLEAAAFGLARGRAQRLRHLDAEAAFRRLVGWLGRRGYGESLARRVAREAVFTSRDDERTAGR